VYDYDLVVIGCGPGGQKAAIAASKLGKRAAVVERENMVGGVCVNTGTIPSKTLREAVLYLTGLNQRELYGSSYRLKDEITMGDLTARIEHVVGREVHVVRDQLHRNHVALIAGSARFVDPHTIVIAELKGDRTVTADKIVIATGTTPARPASVEFDGVRVLDSDDIFWMDKLPPSLVVVGAGVIGIEYASIFAALGTKVTVVEGREQILDFCDREIVEALQYQLRDHNVTFRLGERVAAVEARPDGAVTILDSGKAIASEAVMYSAGRIGATTSLGLETVGIAVDERGRITVDDCYRTSVANVYAVGDVIGFPALAATSMEQGRHASYHAFGEADVRSEREMPIGIYTVPEISYIGRTETELTRERVPYEVGISKYRELARGQIAGDAYGLLKMLVSPDDHALLGIHIFGTGATELIHIGQAVMGCGGTVDYFVDAVFNYPTLSEAYKVAALDVMNKLRTLARLGRVVSGGPLP
jgi:NAD(P) transhydrogenase